MIAIQPPTNCPSCNSVLGWINHLLYCNNSSCGSQQAKKFEHFAKSLKIKGLGPVAIAKLKLESLEDLYSRTQEEIAFLLTSDRLAEKLVFELENSKNATLNSLLPAFSISLIGKSATIKLAAVCDSIDDIDKDTCALAKIGPKATENLLNWINLELPFLRDLPFSFTFTKKLKLTPSTQVVCITGKLKSYKTKAEATEVLESCGFTVKDNLTNEVTILVNESGLESAKTKRARDSGIPIVTNLKDFIGDNK